MSLGETNWVIKSLGKENLKIKKDLYHNIFHLDLRVHWGLGVIFTVVTAFSIQNQILSCLRSF